MKKIAIIGGGASGLIAAYFAAGENKEVTLFEKQKKLGRKILISGNGRCNISNRNIDVSKYHGQNPKFIHNVFSRFGQENTENFFQSIGLPFVEGKKGRLFPASLQASTVTRLLEYELNKKNINIALHRRIDEILPEKNNFKVITAGKEKHIFDSIILSTGNCAYPHIGGTMSGLEIAESLGHRVYKPFPSILPINIPLKAIHRLQGIKWDCSINVQHRGKSIASTSGELLFTGYGLSGTAALDVSRAVNEKAGDSQPAEIIIDFFPGDTLNGLLKKLRVLWIDGSKKVSFSLLGILKERMPEVLLQISGIDSEKRVSSLSNDDMKKIARSLKKFKLFPGNPRTFNEAVVASGGVDVNEIDHASMESKLVKNLFLTGELLDIDGDSGGYNLQFAWSTGAIAGMAQ